MSGAIHLLPQYAFMAWCLVEKHMVPLRKMIGPHSYCV